MKIRYEDIYPITMIIAGTVSIIYIYNLQNRGMGQLKGAFMMKKKCVVVMIAVGIAVITGGICTAVCVIRRKRKGT